MKIVCIVDDQQVVLAALRSIFAESPAIRLIGEFTTAEEFIRQYDQLRPDVTVIDLDLPGMSGIDAILLVKSRYPEAKFLVLTIYDDDWLFKALKAGADGYLLKKDSFEHVVSAIETIFEGGVPMTSGVAKKVIQYFRRPVEFSKFNQLTEKEFVVLEFLSDGLLYKEIADKLSVGIDAIKKHTQNIYQKLHVRTRSEAIKKFLTNFD